MTTSSSAHWPSRALAGVLVGAAGLAVSQAATAALNERLSPPEAVAEAVVQVTPGRLALTLVHLVGKSDKPLLLGGTFVGLLVLSAVAGLVTRGGVGRGQAVFGLMALVGAASVLTRPNSDPTAILPLVLGAATWFVLLPVLVNVIPAGATASTPREEEQGRRDFVIRASLVALGAAVVGLGGQLLGRNQRSVEAARARLKLPVTAGTVPPGAQVPVPGMGPWRVPNQDFYRIDTAFGVPAVAADTWRLRIHGMVEKELRFTYKDLLDRQLTQAWVTLCCVSNGVGGNLIGNAWWSGVRIADLLAEAKPRPGADAVLQTSDDGWTCGTPLGALTDGRDAMLAVAMNGQPLPLEHGYPVRTVVPGLYGFVSACKWVVDLEVTQYSRFSAFWTSRGWSEKGPIKTESRIDVPRANTRVSAGNVRVGGVAWAQHTGIRAVDVRLDGGPWTPVTLGRVPSVDTWVQWGGTVHASPGVHKLAVRATDRSGYVQTGARRDVVPSGATGWHTIEFTAE